MFVQPQIPFQAATYPTLNPVVQPNIIETFIPQGTTPHLAVTNGAPDNNIINDAVMFEDDYVDLSHLPIEYMDLDVPVPIFNAPNHSGHDSPQHVGPLPME